eukprot:1328452-Rhodomonas_salina.2
MMSAGGEEDDVSTTVANVWGRKARRGCVDDDDDDGCEWAGQEGGEVLITYRADMSNRIYQALYGYSTVFPNTHARMRTACAFHELCDEWSSALSAKTLP